MNPYFRSKNEKFNVTKRFLDKFILQTQSENSTKYMPKSKLKQQIQNSIATAHLESKIRSIDNSALLDKNRKRKKRQIRKCARRKCNMVRNFSVISNSESMPNIIDCYVSINKYL